MVGQLHTAAEAAAILKVRESWLKTKAAARLDSVHVRGQAPQVQR